MSNLRSSHLNPGAPTTATRSTARRFGTVSLEVQAAYKFALAIAVGVGGVFAVASSVLAGLTLIVAVIVAGRALVILGAQPGDRKTFRPTGEAALDAFLASSWAVIALVLAAEGAVVGALVAGTGAVALAFLRLRTRYVI